jgi:heat shock protein HtpX
MKRILLFLATNIAVMLVMSVVLSLLGVDRFLTRAGLNLPMLAVFSLVVGFSGAIVSLLISKPMAKWSTGAHVLDAPSSSTELWLVDTVRKLSARAGLQMPEVAVYEGEANAFATGAFKNSALVAVSTGLLESMTHEEIEAVLAHEVAHIANGDMVTMTLIQGVVNTFVVFLSRVVGFAVDRALSRDSNSGPGVGYMVAVMVSQVIFGIGASMIVAWFSRHREFRADAGSASLLGSPQPMMHALARLGGLQPGALPQSLAAAGINDTPGFMELFSSHPPIQERIAALAGTRT